MPLFLFAFVLVLLATIIVVSTRMFRNADLRASVHANLTVWVLPPEQFDEFITFIDGPGRVLPKLAALMAEPSPFTSARTDDSAWAPQHEPHVCILGKWATCEVEIINPDSKTNSHFPATHVCAHCLESMYTNDTAKAIDGTLTCRVPNPRPWNTHNPVPIADLADWERALIRDEIAQNAPA